MKTFLSTAHLAFTWTWKTSTQAVFVVVAILLLQNLLARWLSPRLRYALSFLVVCRLLLPVAPSSSLSLENLFAQPIRFAQTTLKPSGLTQPAEQLGIPNKPVVTSIPARGDLSLTETAMLLWLTGLLTLLTTAAWRYGRWKHLIRSGITLSDDRLLRILDSARKAMGVHRPVKLVSLTQLSTPAVFGIRHICLLLPEKTMRLLDDRELRLVFMHEMAHVRGNDPLLNTFLIVLQLVHWFNPFVWIGLRRLRADRELMCDALVIERSGEDERLSYGQLLIRLLEIFSAPPCVFPASAIPVMGSKREIKRRILVIKHPPSSGLLSILATSLLSLAVVATTFTRASQYAAANHESSDEFQRTLVTPFQRADTLRITSDDGAPNTVTVTYGQTQLKARELSVDLDTGQLQALGHVRVEQAGRNATMDQFITNFKGKQQASQPRDGTRVQRAGTTLRITSEPGAAANKVTVAYGQTRLITREVIVNLDTGQLHVLGELEFEQPGRSATMDNFTASFKGNPQSTQPPVAEIQVRFVGPALLGEEAVRTNIHSRVGNLADRTVVDQDIRDLYATGFFHNIRETTEETAAGTKLVYTVQCNPLLEGLSFKGNTKFTEAELNRIIESKAGKPLSERQLFKDSEQIRDKYDRSGYPGAAVTYATELDEATGKAKAIFIIVEKRP